MGLVGRNGSGKTTLLRHVTGLVLPDEGECVTLGRPSSRLGRRELTRLGAVHHEDRLLDWMRSGQLLTGVGVMSPSTGISPAPIWRSAARLSPVHRPA